ncbi:hypothetical protein FRC16_011395 [Serendipita sp. 398]|nr:hypothetical protein FRC16_011395 [Serendipita sp. 398]
MPIQTEPIEAIDSITPTAFSQAMRNILIGHDTTIGDHDTFSSSQTRPQPSLDFWLETGDIVLRVEYLIFKIHKNTLAEHSIIFSDMLNLGVPMAGEQVEGVPYVELQDSAGDWIELLKWMYTGLPSYHEDSVIPFSTLKAHLSLSYNNASGGDYACSRCHNALQKIRYTSCPTCCLLLDVMQLKSYATPRRKYASPSGSRTTGDRKRCIVTDNVVFAYRGSNPCFYVTRVNRDIPA